MLLTERKAWRLLKHEGRQKRGAGLKPLPLDGERIVRSSPPRRKGVAGEGAVILDKEPTPQIAAQLAEECQRLLNLLNKEDLREVAVWKMEGYTNEEIAAKRSCALRTVERKLKTIRALWQAEDRS